MTRTKPEAGRRCSELNMFAKESTALLLEHGSLANVGTTTPLLALSARNSEWVNLAAAQTVESIADPAPSFPLTAHSSVGCQPA